jgi:tetratricopeptide (TPR) repeat protein
MHHEWVREDLPERLAAARSSQDAEALNQLGCDLADADRQADAEWCFRRSVELGETWAAFNLGNALSAQGRWGDAVPAYETAIGAGESDAWLNLGHALKALGDLAGAMRAYQAAADAGDPQGPLALAFMLREQGERDQAERLARVAADMGNDTAAAVVACWLWDRTEDPSLEDALRQGAQHYPSARAALAHLLVDTHRVEAARSVLEQGAKLGEVECWLPLGNLYWDEFEAEAAAEAAYRSGIEAGDGFSHLNLGRLLESRGDLVGAEEQYRLGVEAGDVLAAKALREFLDKS